METDAGLSRASGETGDGARVRTVKDATCVHSPFRKWELSGSETSALFQSLSRRPGHPQVWLIKAFKVYEFHKSRLFMSLHTSGYLLRKTLKHLISRACRNPGDQQSPGDTLKADELREGFSAMPKETAQNL